MIIEETAFAYEISVKESEPGVTVAIRQDGEHLEVDFDQVPALIAALQKFYDGEGQ